MVSESFTTVASIAGSAMLFRSIIRELLPNEVRDYIYSAIDYLRTRLSSQLTVIIQETEGYTPNQIYRASKTYLATKIPPSTRRLRVSKQEEEKSMAVCIEPGEVIVDVFEGIQFKWASVCQEKTQLGRPNSHNYNQTPMTTEARSFELSFHMKHRDTAMGSYLRYVLDQAKAIEDEEKTLKIYMNEGTTWSEINLHHPATFETLAMDSELKQGIMDDLARFVKRKEYYKKIGKAWKRGYLLYGPPGTGKSSLIAAMANFLKFNIYDLDLSEVDYNSLLRMLLVGTSNRSILVLEDIDCAIDLQHREESKDTKSSKEDDKDKITLSGLLNFIDGLWSSCGEERIIVFTTNYKDRLDPALLRPGRMDMHVHMGYCGPSAFRVLASNYHSVDHHHHLFGEIEELLREVEVTPAEVAEELMRSDDAEVALLGLVNLIRGKRKDVGEADADINKLES